MSIIELEEIRLLKQSEKSMVLLVREMDGEQLFVRKILQGRHEIYETLKACSHPYLPKLYDVTVSDDTTVILEEYIDGQTLDRDALTEKSMLTAVKDLCSVLQFLHEKGIIHRDVKPSNIILAQDGHIRLIDFDAARMIKGNIEQDTKLLGTRGYAPPEQYGFAQTDARADIYSLGVTFQQLLGEKAKRLRYKKIIAKCTDMNPKKRYQSVLQVKKAFFFPYSSLALISVIMIIAAILLSLQYKHPQPEEKQAYYPDDDLLFYAKGGEYIILYPDDAQTAILDNAPHMQIDMTGNGDFVDFILPYSLNNWSEYGEEYDLGFNLGSLADGIAASFWRDGNKISLWPIEIEDMLRNIPYDPFVLSETGLLTQITCADADSDGIKELFVSKGDREHALLTTVWTLADTAGKAFEPVGVMWGTSVMYLYENGDIRSIVNGNQLNHYNYSVGALSIVSGIDFENFKSLQKAEAEKEN